MKFCMVTGIFLTCDILRFATTIVAQLNLTSVEGDQIRLKSKWKSSYL